MEMPEEIADEELLARYIFSPSMVDEYGVSRQAFQLNNLKGGPEKYVSVDRATYREPKPEYYPFKPRKESDKLIGYGLLTVSAVRTTRINKIWAEVKPHGNKRNPYHAGIHYYNNNELIAGECEYKDFIIFITKLSKACSIHKF